MQQDDADNVNNNAFNVYHYLNTYMTQPSLRAEINTFANVSA